MSLGGFKYLFVILETDRGGEVVLRIIRGHEVQDSSGGHDSLRGGECLGLEGQRAGYLRQRTRAGEVEEFIPVRCGFEIHQVTGNPFGENLRRDDRSLLLEPLDRVSSGSAERPCPLPKRTVREELKLGRLARQDSIERIGTLRMAATRTPIRAFDLSRERRNSP
jgi:hypothetical protein